MDGRLRLFYPGIHQQMATKIKENDRQDHEETALLPLGPYINRFFRDFTPITRCRIYEINNKQSTKQWVMSVNSVPFGNITARSKGRLRRGLQGGTTRVPTTEEKMDEGPYGKGMGRI